MTDLNTFIITSELQLLRRMLEDAEHEVDKLNRQLREAHEKLSAECARHFDEMTAEQRAHSEKARELEYVRTVADYRGLKLQTRIEGYERRSVPRGVERRKP